MFILNIKTSDIKSELKKEIKEKLEKDIKSIIQTLGKSAIKHAEELAQKQLPNSLNKIYKDNLYMEQISDNIVEVGIRKEALWIEEGRKSGFMDELLKGSNVKISKDGHKYRSIPFEHSTKIEPKTSTNKKEEIEQLKKFLKSEGIRYSKTRALELDDKGSPRIGRIHSFDIKKMRDSNKKSAQKLSPNLEGLSVYQRENPQTGKVERSIMTFRTISEKHKETGKWEHPGRKGEKIIDDTFKYIQEMWEKELFPELKREYEK
jgi:hypothetical protein